MMRKGISCPEGGLAHLLRETGLNSKLEATLQWYKHDSNANSDAKLKKLRIKYGMEGYGLYWYCLELIAANVDAHNLTFELEHDSEVISHDTGIHYERVQEMMTYMVSLGLFENNNGTITCLKLRNRLAKSMTSSPEIRKLIDKSKTESSDYAGYVYFIGGKGDLIKIGRSKNPWQRLKELRRKHGGHLDLICTLRSHNCVELETALHRAYRDDNDHDEFFLATPEINDLTKKIESGEISSHNQLLAEVSPTTSVRSSNYVTPEENRIEENRREENREGALASANGSPNRVLQRGVRTCPKWFVVTDDLQAYAEDKIPADLVPHEVEKFRNHEFARPRRDWEATFRNWICKAAERNPKPKAANEDLRWMARFND